MQVRPRLSPEEYQVILNHRKNCTAKTVVKQNPDFVPPKIFVLDIETSFMLVEVFSLFGNKYISHESIYKDWHMLTWSGAYISNGIVLSDGLTADESLNRDDSRIIKSLWNHLHNADIVVIHNGLRFDMPKFNTRMMKHGYAPYSPVRVIDTLVQVKKIGGHTSNRLDYISSFYEIGKKIETNRKLWHDCSFGDYETMSNALAEMETYNRHDVEILLDVYLTLRPYMKTHPNLGVYIHDNKERCHYCGSDNLQITSDYYTTNLSKFQLYTCLDCTGYTPSRFTMLPKSKRDNLLKSLP